MVKNPEQMKGWQVIMRDKVITLADIKKNSKIVLWGAGIYIYEIIELLGEEKIITIIDNSPQKWGTKIKEITIQDPSQVMKKLDLEKTVFLVSVVSFNYEIALCLKEKWGIKPEHIFCVTHKFAEKYMYDINAIQDNPHKIKEVLEMLSDEESKKYFQNLIKSRLTRNPLFLKENEKIVDRYYYKSENHEIRVREKDTILDCGAFIGDTAKFFWEETHGICKIYCFEPLEGNYKRLRNWVDNNQCTKKVICIQALLDEKEGRTEIVSSQESSVCASIEQEGNFKNEVMVKTIDSVVNEKVDFIKMDIEGLELKALIGAQGIIKRYKPQMVISAYHRTSHLWEIPKLIKKIEPLYKVYLGHQLNAAFEPEYYLTI